MLTQHGRDPERPEHPESPEPKAASAPPAAEADSRPESGVLDMLGRFRTAGAAAIATIAVIVNIGIYWEKQWFAASVAALIVAMFLAVYVLVRRPPATLDGAPRTLRHHAASARNVAAAFVVGIPLATLVGFIAYKMAPLFFGNGTTIAIAQFAGPPLPSRYANCRPSNMLADRLGEATSKFNRRFSVYELPYNIDSNTQWAHALARWRGWLHNADVVVFGSYALRSAGDGKSAGDMFIDTHVESVLGPRPAWKGIALDTWDLPNRLVSIDALCGNGAVPAFINDAKRLALSLLGLQLLNEHNYEGARDALNATVDDGTAGTARREDCIVPVHQVGSSTCTPVLAFYLATLYQQLGQYPEAERAYLKAEELPRAAPRVNLGELYAQEGNVTKALAAFNDAVKVEPTSIPALAARAIYERQAGKASFAAIDLDRAQRLPARTQDDYAAVSRALYERGGSSKCAIASLEAALRRNDFDSKTMNDTLVVYGRWLYNDGRIAEANATLERALDVDPDNIKANYTLGLIARRQAQPQTATAYFVRAMRSNAYTDEQLLDQGNAASELHDDFDALTYYNRSINVNHHAVYALTNRASLYERAHRYGDAERDYRTAVAIHPREAFFRSHLAALLRRERRPAEAAAQDDAGRRSQLSVTSELDRQFWSSDACRYVRMDSPATASLAL